MDEQPAAWQEDAAWDLPEPDYSPIPDRVAHVTVNMREVFASWNEAQLQWEAKMYDELAMDETPTVPTDMDVEVWRLRRNLELSPDERLEQLRRAVQWVAQYRGQARSAVRPRPKATGN